MSADDEDPSPNRGAKRSLLVLLVVLVLGGLGWTTLYTVTEWEQAVITQFGEVVGDPVTDAGLHFKMPYQQVQRFDARLLRWDGSETTTITRDRKTVNVDVTARWRISDAKQFLEAIRSTNQADTRLNGIIAGAVKDEIAKYDLYEVIRSSNRILEVSEDEITIDLESPEMENITVEEVATLGSDLPELPVNAEGLYLAGRPIVLDNILAEARKRLRQIGLGISLEDILIKQLNYTEEIEENVYAQMNAELQKISAGFRSQNASGKWSASSPRSSRKPNGAPRSFAVAPRPNPFASSPTPTIRIRSSSVSCAPSRPTRLPSVPTPSSS